MTKMTTGLTCRYPNLLEWRSTSFSSVLTGILRALEDQASFDSSSLGQARRASQRKRKKRSKHSSTKNDPTTPPSEEAFVQARQRVPREFWQNLLIILADAFHQQHQATLRFKQFRILALDGTRIPLPYHKPLIQHFGTAKNQKKASCPQARMLMLQFPFTRFPYRYELTKLREGEITVGQRLLKSLQPHDLVLLDAGFWSFSLFADVAQKQSPINWTQKQSVTTTGLAWVRLMSRGDCCKDFTHAAGKWRPPSAN